MATCSWSGHLTVRHNEQMQFEKILPAIERTMCQMYSIGAVNGNLGIAFSTPDALHIHYAVNGEWMQSLDIKEPVISVCWNPKKETIALNMDSGLIRNVVHRV